MEKHVIADVMFDIDDLLEFNKSRGCNYATNDGERCPVATYIQFKTSIKNININVNNNTTRFWDGVKRTGANHPTWLYEIVKAVDAFEAGLPPEEFEKILNKTKERYANA